MSTSNQQSEDDQKSSRKRPVKAIPLWRQRNILLLAPQAKFESLAEQVAYEAGRATAEIFDELERDGGRIGEEQYKAEDVLAGIYSRLQEGRIDLETANLIKDELETMLTKQNEELREKLLASIGEVNKTKLPE